MRDIGFSSYQDTALQPPDEPESWQGRKCGGCSEWDACPCGCGCGWCRVLHDFTSENDECYKA